MVLAVLLLIFYLPLSYNLSFLVDYHTEIIYDIVVKILHLSGVPFIFYDNSIILPNNFIIDIIDDCNAFLPFLLFVAAILILPIKLDRKVLLIFFGWFLIMLFNILRIIFITLITVQNKKLFFIAHDISTFVFMPLFVVIIYWYFLKNGIKG